jgi:hypothetical protein
MNKKTITKFVQSFAVVPMMSVMIPMTGISAISTSTLVPSQNTVAAIEAITTPQLDVNKANAKILDDYFASYDSPLEGYGMKFVTEADKNDIDWRLLPAIAMRESTGGKQACKKVSNSVFGYGSCKMNFKSIDESIEIVAKSLGGNNPNTAKHYDGKTTLQILRKYNSVIPNYPKQVVSIMKSIDDTDSVE